MHATLKPKAKYGQIPQGHSFVTLVLKGAGIKCAYFAVGRDIAGATTKGPSGGSEKGRH